VLQQSTEGVAERVGRSRLSATDRLFRESVQEIAERDQSSGRHVEPPFPFLRDSWLNFDWHYPRPFQSIWVFDRFSQWDKLLRLLAFFVSVKIGEADQIGNVIILVKKKLEDERKYSPYLHKEIVVKELTERGFEKEVIEEWIEYI
jgi:hypothetical protein